MLTILIMGAFLLISAFLLDTSASLPSFGPYRMPKVFKGFASFLYQYPASFGPLVRDWSVEPLSTSVVATSFDQAGELQGMLYVFVTRVSSALPGAKAMLGDNLHNYEAFMLHDFELLERSRVAVDGMEGERIVYSYVTLRETKQSDSITRLPKVAYEAYFDSKGLIWQIGLDGRADMAKQNEAHFEHILQTFKILR